MPRTIPSAKKRMRQASADMAYDTQGEDPTMKTLREEEARKRTFNRSFLPFGALTYKAKKKKKAPVVKK